MQLHKLARVVASSHGKTMLAVDDRPLFQLNPVAETIWVKLLEGQSAQQIVAQLVTQFGVPEERVVCDVTGFLDLLRRHYLIVDNLRNEGAGAVSARVVGNGSMATRYHGTTPEGSVSQDSLRAPIPDASTRHSFPQNTTLKPDVRTFDLFDTLIARRCIDPVKILELLEKRLNQPGFAARRVQAERELAGTQYTLADIYRRLGSMHEMEVELQLERENIFAVTEVVSKVKSNDVIISDMYLPKDFLRSTVNEVTNLILNPIVSTTNGKSTGTVWETLKDTVHIAEHTGDCPHSDIRMARKHGIPATLAKAAALSVEEQTLYDDGFVGLGQTIREARLTTFENDTFARRLQLLQIQLNFPILFLAALVLDRKLTAAKISNALMSSRDCFLWHHLQERVRVMSGSTYKVIYFLTSRLARRFPSSTYLRYFNNFLNEASCIVDVSGTGTSLKQLVERSANPKTPAFMIARFHSDNRRPTAWNRDIEGSKLTLVVPREGHHSLERANIARHAMVRDVVDLMGTYVPVFFNPAEVPWQELPQLQTQHEAFFQAMMCMERNDFAKDLRVDDAVIVERIEWLFQRMIIFEDWVKHWCLNFEWAEELAAQTLGERLGKEFVVPWMPFSAQHRSQSSS